MLGSFDELIPEEERDLLITLSVGDTFIAKFLPEEIRSLSPDRLEKVMEQALHAAARVVRRELHWKPEGFVQLFDQDDPLLG